MIMRANKCQRKHVVFIFVAAPRMVLPEIIKLVLHCGGLDWHVLSGLFLNSAKLDLASEAHGNKTAMFRDEIEYLHGSLLSRNSKSKYFFSKN